MQVKKILVTGAGGDIGLSVAQCLKSTFPKVHLVGADCRRDTLAPALFDEVLLLPEAGDPQYLDALEKTLETHQPQVFLPLSEAELAILLEHELVQKSVSGVPMVCASAHAVSVGLDKLATAKALRMAGLPFPETGEVGVDHPGDYPLIVKPRSGQGSKAVQYVERADYPSAAQNRRGAIWQRYLAGEDHEYTCGLARFAGVGSRVIIFRRRLSGGFTQSGTLVENAQISDLCLEIAETLDLRGAINVQLRLENEMPMVFEINPRFSSTVGFRHRLGFTDVIWSICDVLGWEVGGYAPPEPGTRIYRIPGEIVVPPPKASISGE